MLQYIITDWRINLEAHTLWKKSFDQRSNTYIYIHLDFNQKPSQYPVRIELLIFSPNIEKVAKNGEQNSATVIPVELSRSIDSSLSTPSESSDIKALYK